MTEESERPTRAEITEDETALYDRQIRLWGLDAQQRMRNASILVAGCGGLSAETCKNLVLAGIGALTLLDDAKVAEEDLGANFFLELKDIGSPRALAVSKRVQTLNPRVAINVDEGNIADKSEEYFKKFDLVCVCDGDLETLFRVNDICRKMDKKFYAAACFGFYGYIFADLNHHVFIDEWKETKSEETVIQRVKKVQDYVSLRDALAKTWHGMSARVLRRRSSPIFFGVHILWIFQQENGCLPTLDDPEHISKLKALRDELLTSKGVDPNFVDDALLEQIARSARAEISPACAVVGGMLAQDILYVLSAKGQPIWNWFAFGGMEGVGIVLRLESGGESN
ncbi:uncharacterized protein VTP21DRAFT_1841 [Calcarisporiella thermophila]|uniref:uncharacterized protein n=1 Tax=Calcarisporiella thermophila TaxID=911321 RepID=UPI003742C042